MQGTGDNLARRRRLGDSNRQQCAERLRWVRRLADVVRLIAIVLVYAGCAAPSGIDETSAFPAGTTARSIRSELSEAALGPLGGRRVTAVHRRSVSEIIVLETERGTIRTTAEHPFARVGGGWTAAADLRADDEIVTSGARATNGLLGQRSSRVSDVECRRVGDGACRLHQERATARVLGVSRERAPNTVVYNFTVGGSHAYFVGSESLLVHNDCTGDTAFVSPHPKIPADAPVGSYVIGNFGADAEEILKSYPQSQHVNMNFDLPLGQHLNMLSIGWDEFSYWRQRPGGFFGNVNALWIDSAVERQAKVYVISSTSEYLYVRDPVTGNFTDKLRGFGKEVHRLEWMHGYRFDPARSEMVPPGTPGWEKLPTLTRREHYNFRDPVEDDRVPPPTIARREGRLSRPRRRPRERERRRPSFLSSGSRWPRRHWSPIGGENHAVVGRA